MVQTGDKSGSGKGSGVEKKYKDELHSRIKFNKRGQVAMANEGRRDSNGTHSVIKQRGWLLCLFVFYALMIREGLMFGRFPRLF